MFWPQTLEPSARRRLGDSARGAAAPGAVHSVISKRLTFDFQCASAGHQPEVNGALGKELLCSGGPRGRGPDPGLGLKIRSPKEDEPIAYEPWKRLAFAAPAAAA